MWKSLRDAVWVGSLRPVKTKTIYSLMSPNPVRTNREPCENEINWIDGRNTSGMC